MRQNRNYRECREPEQEQKGPYRHRSPGRTNLFTGHASGKRNKFLNTVVTRGHLGVVK